MRKSIVVLLFALASLFEVAAKPVDVNTARRVASGFMSAKCHRTVTDMKEVATPFSSFYVFNAPKGFVLVAADDCASPILAYSLTATFRAEKMPSHLRSWL